MSTIIERITIEGDEITASLLVWRRFHKPMPGIVEAIYARNRELAEHGPYLPVGTVVEIPIPVTKNTPDQLDPIRLW